jgi:putative zinc finger/helix-turn-helix YgiT family protein
MGTDSEAMTRTQVCAICEEGVATLSAAHQEFRVGQGEDARAVRAVVPVWTCSACGLEYLDEEGEVTQHAATCRDFGRLTPAEIKAIRRSAKLNQSEFAKKLSVGVASVKRWELGVVIQTAAADESIRRFASELQATTVRQPRFRTEFRPATMRAAQHFQLRRVNEPTLLVPA